MAGFVFTSCGPPHPHDGNVRAAPPTQEARTVEHDEVEPQVPDVRKDLVPDPADEQSSICPPGLRFRKGSGCVPPDGMPCFGGCPPSVDWTRPESYESADGPPPDRAFIARELGYVDVSSCRKASMPPPHGHVKVTFLPSGVVEGVEVDALRNGDEDVRRCISSRFGAIRIPPFRGRSVSQGRSL
jgi:hypothetical protein